MKATKIDNGSKERYCYLTGMGPGTPSAKKALLTGQEVSCTLEMVGRRIEAYDINKARIGWVSGPDDPQYEIMKSADIDGALVVDSKQIAEYFCDNTNICATVIAMPVTGRMKVRITISENGGAQSKTSESEKEVDFNLSSFSNDDRQKVQDRIDYLRKSTKLSTAVIRDVVEWLKNHSGISEFTPAFENNNEIVEKAVRSVLAGRNIRLIGPKGCGKNHMIEHLASLFDLKLYDMQMSDETSKDDLFGEPTIGDGGRIEFSLSYVLRAVQEPSLINFDEANMARASIESLLHSLMDYRGYIDVPKYGRVCAHPQARFSITMNEGDEYEGTHPLNAALKDRTRTIRFKSNPEAMLAIFKTECGLNEKDAKELWGYYKVIYNAVYSGNEGLEEEVLSQRCFSEAGLQYSKGYFNSIREAVLDIYPDSVDDEEQRDIVRQLLLINK